MKTPCRIIAAVCAAFILICGLAVALRASYPRPYAETVRASGIPPSLAYAVMKAESNFDETAVSRAGAVGIMQIRPSTAEYICRRQGMEFHAEKLLEGNYNVTIGCMYLAYLLERFPDERAAICAYNAGEGTVRRWLADQTYSADGNILSEIPYPETRTYAKKVSDFRKIYEIFYG
ncbi:MAG TPA: lytic transglycosylase domain-containing protein [Firmicutes bacterium]|nr:lytic transglycosylase domain-containing protein [Bacillota bacterium]